jgi:hypothetical protein
VRQSAHIDDPKVVFKIAGHFPGCPPFHSEINFLLFIFKFSYQTIGPGLARIGRDRREMIEQFCQQSKTQSLKNSVYSVAGDPVCASKSTKSIELIEF